MQAMSLEQDVFSAQWRQLTSTIAPYTRDALGGKDLHKMGENTTEWMGKDQLLCTSVICLPWNQCAMSNCIQYTRLMPFCV